MEAILQFRPRLKATQLSNQNALTIMAVMMFIVVMSIVLVTVAFVQNDEFTEDDNFDDFLAIGGWGASWTIIFTTLSFVLNLDLEFLILSIVAEYLRSHIGEKRLGDWTIEFKNLYLIPDSLMTTLFKVVICFSVLRCYQIHVHKRTNILFLTSRIYSTLFYERITQGGILL
jgi:hypothetical protein